MRPSFLFAEGCLLFLREGDLVTPELLPVFYLVTPAPLWLLMVTSDLVICCLHGHSSSVCSRLIVVIICFSLGFLCDHSLSMMCFRHLCRGSSSVSPARMILSLRSLCVVSIIFMRSRCFWSVPALWICIIIYFMATVVCPSVNSKTLGDP